MRGRRTWTQCIFSILFLLFSLAGRTYALEPCPYHQTIIHLTSVSTAVTQTLSLPIDFETLAAASVIGVGEDGATTMVVEGPYIGGPELSSVYCAL
jgi:hypothetical protein